MTPLEKAKEWLTPDYDETTRKEIEQKLSTDPTALIDAFFKDLSFGTGGMRGLVGVGTNRMNVYTIRKATQGLANHLKKQNKESYSIFIGYDVRSHSKLFAEETASVLIANGIQVFLTQKICPTPLVSFGCRYFGCDGAIVITASHNPPEYNGYKVYGSDGGQLTFPHDQAVMEEISRIKDPVPAAPLTHSNRPLFFTNGMASSLLHWVGEEIDQAYLHELQSLKLCQSTHPEKLKIVYSPLHGTGIRLVPKALESWGFSHVTCVEKQSLPDGNFSYAPSPNPEDPKAFALGFIELEKQGGDLLLLTDPDADRVGAAIPGKIRFTGHQMGSLLLHHILKMSPHLPSNGAVIKTIVTSELFTKIASRFSIACFDVLTGFKYISEKISLWEKSFGGYQFLFGAEESYGALCGNFVRDKDAVSISCLIAEMASCYKQEGKTLLDGLYDLYRIHGVHREESRSLQFPDTKEGVEKMSAFMQELRDSPPSSIGEIPVRKIDDFSLPQEGFPLADVLRIWLKDNSKLVIRPSGTEPKIKIYAEVVGGKENLEEEIAYCDQKLTSILIPFIF